MRRSATGPLLSANALSAPALYVHVPYCARKCEYCAFNSAAGRSRQEQARYVNAVLQETQRALIDRQNHVSSIYVGGGTPTELEPQELDRLLGGIAELTHRDKRCEWTVEANPGTLTKPHIQALQRHGVNRVSMGVQSMDNESLQRLGRVHDAEEVRSSVRILREAGIQRINLDLIYGQPWQSESGWLSDLDQILDLQPDHLSAYALQYEEGTPFLEALRQGKLQACPDEQVRQMFDLACQRLEASGFHLYEISNFCREGQESVHNLNYWRNLEYYGIGAGAFGRIGSLRTRNVNSPVRYIELVEGGASALEETDHLGPREDWMESLTSGLRTREGVSLATLDERTGAQTQRWCSGILEDLRGKGLVHADSERLRLTHDGLWVLDSILVKLFEAWPRG